jgi:hypothetical protein
VVGVSDTLTVRRRARQSIAANPNPRLLHRMNPTVRTPKRVTLFSVPFHSAMTDSDLDRLRTSLDLVLYTDPKPGVSGASPGVARLDLWSGLFLEPGGGKEEWALEARTWGDPPAASVEEWHVRAALAARELDPSVPIPARPPGA